MSKEYRGSCHCSAVRFIYSGEEIRKGVFWNCSICTRKGALMGTAPIPPTNLVIEAEDDVLDIYDTFINRYVLCDVIGKHQINSKQSIQLGVKNVFDFTNPVYITNISGREYFIKYTINLD